MGLDVDSPYPDLLAAMTGRVVVNLGCAQAGPDAFLGDAALQLAMRADRAVVELPDIRNLSNRFYLVHPRRNDRFVAPSSQLRALFPEVDFSAIHFTRHLIATLDLVCDERCAEVLADLHRTWLRRMAVLLDVLPDPVLLDLNAPGKILGDSAALGCPVVHISVGEAAETHGRIAHALLPQLSHSLPVSSGTRVNRSPTRP